ncbi:DUF2913 family protein [Shewanella maritima]|uniref:DUF2913 family protein n=1 Tax=Shewanella maritima TaxID=2520507 RepID=UPI003735F5AB
MTPQNYNQAILALAQTAISELEQWSEQFKSPRTPAQQSHYLCSWLVEALKKKRFSKLVAQDIESWIRMARSQGAGAQLPKRMQQIVKYYSIAQQSELLGDQLQSLFAQLEQQDWTVINDTEIDAKLKLNSDGSSSIIACAQELTQGIEKGELVKPINLYVRGSETTLASLGLSLGLIFSQGNKKTSLIKHHKTYQVSPHNQHANLCLLLLDD